MTYTARTDIERMWTEDELKELIRKEALKAMREFQVRHSGTDAIMIEAMRSKAS